MAKKENKAQLNAKHMITPLSPNPSMYPHFTFSVDLEGLIGGKNFVATYIPKVRRTITICSANLKIRKRGQVLIF